MPNPLRELQCDDTRLQVEVGEKKDRVTDALNATKAAVEEGIVPGAFLSSHYSILPAALLHNQSSHEMLCCALSWLCIGLCPIL